MNIAENIYDGDTLKEVLTHIVESRGKKSERAVCDQGYRVKRCQIHST